LDVAHRTFTLNILNFLKAVTVIKTSYMWTQKNRDLGYLLLWLGALGIGFLGAGNLRIKKTFATMWAPCLFFTQALRCTVLYVLNRPLFAWNDSVLKIQAASDRFPGSGSGGEERPCG
jgi:hypothetical protein